MRGGGWREILTLFSLERRRVCCCRSKGSPHTSRNGLDSCEQRTAESSTSIQKLMRKRQEGTEDRSQSIPKTSDISAIPDEFDSRLHSPRKRTLPLFCQESDLNSSTCARTRNPVMISPAAPRITRAPYPKDAPTAILATASPSSIVTNSDEIASMGSITIPTSPKGPKHGVNVGSSSTCRIPNVVIVSVGHASTGRIGQAFTARHIVCASIQI